MFICTFYHTPVAFCDRGIVFYITKGVSLMRHPLVFYLSRIFFMPVRRFFLRLFFLRLFRNTAVLFQKNPSRQNAAG